MMTHLIVFISLIDRGNSAENKTGNIQTFRYCYYEFSLALDFLIPKSQDRFQ